MQDAIKHWLTAFGAIIWYAEANVGITKLARGIPVIIRSLRGSLRSAVDLMKRRAADYLPKACKLDEFKRSLVTQSRIGPVEILGECDSNRSLSD